jgi:hypothetical protein
MLFISLHRKDENLMQFEICIDFLNFLACTIKELKVLSSALGEFGQRIAYTCVNSLTNRDVKNHLHLKETQTIICTRAHG